MPAPAPAPKFLVDETAVEDALVFLSETATDYGKAKGEVVRTESMLKRIRSIEFLRHDGPVAAREAEALSSSAYLRAINEHVEATTAYEIMRAKRDAAIAKIEVWRTESANYRKV